MEPQHYLSEIRDQYEQFPYPLRNPDDEKKRLLSTSGDVLPKVNHYCFNGKETFCDNFRVLVAGGGTGDPVIFLAHQLRKTNAQIVYLDISKNSMEIAQQRAKIRNLTNIEWLHASIIDLPKLGLEPFDYITCSGVLHHLENPEQGLGILSDALSDNGAIYLLIYAKYGRTGIYQIQELMRKVNETATDNISKINNTKRILGALPETNWFKRDESRWEGELAKGEETELYDLFLNENDICFSVDELYKLCNKAKLNIIDFVPSTLEEKARYLPNNFINNKNLTEIILKKTKQEQQAIAELISGFIRNHEVYLTKSNDTKALFDDITNVPIAYNFKPQEIYSDICKSGILSIKVNELAIEFTPTLAQKLFFKYLNNKNNLSEIVNKIEQEFTRQDFDSRLVTEQIKAVYNTFNAADLIFLQGN